MPMDSKTYLGIWDASACDTVMEGVTGASGSAKGSAAGILMA